MNVVGRRQGYSFLIKWIVLVGDLLCLNLFFIVLFKILGTTDYPRSFFHPGEFFLVVNLAYFIASTIVPVNISLNIVFFDKIIQRSITFITFYCIILTIGVTLLEIHIIPIYALIICYICLCFFYSLWHILFRMALKRYRQSGHNYKRVIIVGGGLNGLKVYSELSSSRVYGYKVLGIFDDNEALKYTHPAYRGTVLEVEAFCIEHRIDEIYCTLPGNQEEKVMRLINFSEKNMIKFYLVPEFYKYIKRKLVMNFLESTPIIEIRSEPLQNMSNRVLKRTFDIVFSVVILITIFPIVYVICGILIKLESRGPILFSQKRTGLHGKVFKCYKFRSMRQNAEADLITTAKKDPRITKIGNFMRKTSLDEIPQFINVVKGDMSVVGPRPHMIKQTEIYNKLIDAFMIRHLIKPGVTGWAQISGFRGEIKTVEQMEGRFRCDVWYIENWTFVLDIKIIFVTIYRMIFGDKDAY